MGKDFLTEPGAATVRKTFFTLPSEEPSDRRGILSLSPLGLEEAAEGYFLRSEAKKGGSGESRGKKEGEREREGGQRKMLESLQSFCWN